MNQDIIGYSASSFFLQCCSVEVRQLKSGKWRAYLVFETTPGNRNSNYGYSLEVVRDLDWHIITGTSRTDLILQLKKEYPGWHWDVKSLK